jgi:hypothetical protein
MLLSSKVILGLFTFCFIHFFFFAYLIWRFMDCEKRLSKLNLDHQILDASVKKIKFDLLVEADKVPKYIKKDFVGPQL